MSSHKMLDFIDMQCAKPALLIQFAALLILLIVSCYQVAISQLAVPGDRFPLVFARGNWPQRNSGLRIACAVATGVGIVVMLSRQYRVVKIGAILSCFTASLMGIIVIIMDTTVLQDAKKQGCPQIAALCSYTPFETTIGLTICQTLSSFILAAAMVHKVYSDRATGTSAVKGVSSLFLAGCVALGICGALLYCSIEQRKGLTIMGGPNTRWRLPSLGTPVVVHESNSFIRGRVPYAYGGWGKNNSQLRITIAILGLIFCCMSFFPFGQHAYVASRVVHLICTLCIIFSVLFFVSFAIDWSQLKSQLDEDCSDGYRCHFELYYLVVLLDFFCAVLYLSVALGEIILPRLLFGDLPAQAIENVLSTVTAKIEEQAITSEDRLVQWADGVDEPKVYTISSDAPDAPLITVTIGDGERSIASRLLEGTRFGDGVQLDDVTIVPPDAKNEKRVNWSKASIESSSAPTAASQPPTPRVGGPKILSTPRSAGMGAVRGFPATAPAQAPPVEPHYSEMESHENMMVCSKCGKEIPFSRFAAHQETCVIFHFPFIGVRCTDAIAPPHCGLDFGRSYCTVVSLTELEGVDIQDGDVLLKFGDNKIANRKAFRNHLAKAVIGSRVKIELYRPSEKAKHTVIVPVQGKPFTVPKP